MLSTCGGVGGGGGGGRGPVARVLGWTGLVPGSAGGAGLVLEVTETRSELKESLEPGPRKVVPEFGSATGVAREPGCMGAGLEVGAMGAGWVPGWVKNPGPCT